MRHQKYLSIAKQVINKSNVVKSYKKNKQQQKLSKKNKLYLLSFIGGVSMLIVIVFVFYTIFYNPVPSIYYGTWVNTTNTKNIAKVLIQNINGKTFVQLFGAGLHELIPWGSAQATYSENTLSGFYSFNYKYTRFTISLGSDNRLNIETFNHYIDNSNRFDINTTDLLKKQL